MSWSWPRTWTNGEVPTAAIMNADIRDNLRYRKGMDGMVEIGTGLEVTGTSSYLKTAGITTTQRGSLDVGEGPIIYNSDKGMLEANTSKGWAEIMAVDGTAVQGDVPIRGTSGWERLGPGVSGQLLQTQGAGANARWR